LLLHESLALADEEPRTASHTIRFQILHEDDYDDIGPTMALSPQCRDFQWAWDGPFSTNVQI